MFFFKNICHMIIFLVTLYACISNATDGALDADKLMKDALHNLQRALKQDNFTAHIVDYKFKSSFSRSLKDEVHEGDIFNTCDLNYNQQTRIFELSTDNSKSIEFDLNPNTNKYIQITTNGESNSLVQQSIQIVTGKLISDKMIGHLMLGNMDDGLYIKASNPHPWSITFNKINIKKNETIESYTCWVKQEDK